MATELLRGFELDDKGGTLEEQQTYGKLHSLLTEWAAWRQSVADWFDIIEHGGVIENEDWASCHAALEALFHQGEAWMDAPQRAVIITISPGPGGEEARDFCHILGRMYLRWAEVEQWEIDVLAQNDGGWLLRVDTPRAWTAMQQEHGAHRLIRVSPFDSQKRVHTSFAFVAVLEEKEERELVIDKNDVRVDVMRSSGAGGQHVNKTESAVRLTHLPTGISVVCQNGRSQHSNKKTAWSVLQERLERHFRSQESEAEKSQGGWGRQIRTYHVPADRVKNHDTGEARSVKRIWGGEPPRWTGRANGIMGRGEKRPDDVLKPDRCLGGDRD